MPRATCRRGKTLGQLNCSYACLPLRLSALWGTDLLACAVPRDRQEFGLQGPMIGWGLSFTVRAASLVSRRCRSTKRASVRMPRRQASSFLMSRLYASLPSPSPEQFPTRIALIVASQLRGTCRRPSRRCGGLGGPPHCCASQEGTALASWRTACRAWFRPARMDDTRQCSCEVSRQGWAEGYATVGTRR